MKHLDLFNIDICANKCDGSTTVSFFENVGQAEMYEKELKAILPNFVLTNCTLQNEVIYQNLACLQIKVDISKESPKAIRDIMDMLINYKIAFDFANNSIDMYIRTDCLNYEVNIN